MTTGPTDMDDDDFGALLEASLSKKRRHYSVGEKVKATVMQVGHERLLLDLGEGQDALMELKQFELEPGATLEVKEGDVVEGYILGFDNRVPEIGLKLGKGHGGRQQLEEAFQSGVPVQGHVVEVNKGGYVVEVGAARCFCPLGQMDTRRIEDPAVMVGQKLLFRVTELKGLRDVVLSRRALLEEENARRAAETRQKLTVGARLRGTVSSVRDFGAFVDLGGIEGLVPASEIGYGRARPADAVSSGQAVDVQIINMEEGKDGRERITLSMKALLDDPFAQTAAELPLGAVVAGTITRCQPFGAFVEIVPGVEGLIHVSAFGKRVAHPADVVKPGQEVAVRVEGVDLDARRVSLHYADQADLEAAPDAPAGRGRVRVLRLAEVRPAAEPAPRSSDEAPRLPGESARPAAPAVHVGDVFDVKVDKAESYGVFVSWASGRGLVPGRELGVPRHADLRRQFPVGTQFKAVVLDIREDGKLTLSKTAVEAAQERADAAAYRQQAPATQGSGLGTLGDLLKIKKGR